MIHPSILGVFCVRKMKVFRPELDIICAVLDENYDMTWEMLNMRNMI